jgi:hypothetical protein
MSHGCGADGRGGADQAEGFEKVATFDVHPLPHD